MYYVYMLRCEDNSLYTGITVDVLRRMREHFLKSDKCAKYTMTHGAKKLEAVWQTENRILASKLEYYIKRMTKSQKEELLVKNNLTELPAEKIDAERYERIHEVQKYCPWQI